MWSAPQQVDPAGGSGSPEVARGGVDDRRGLARSLSESVISLVLAVLLFRTFAAEGYMISTGSMAPTLLGYHKQVNCPTCGFEFPFGVAYDTDPTGEAEQLERRRSVAVCPNCGQEHIHLEKVPRNHGDQLLVCKPSYEYRPPLRWEICVFRNPANPQEAYVKRVVGLPGERVQILRGDVFIDGEIARKDYPRQVSMRIPVHDHNSRASRSPLAQTAGLSSRIPRSTHRFLSGSPTARRSACSRDWRPASMQRRSRGCNTGTGCGLAGDMPAGCRWPPGRWMSSPPTQRPAVD